MTRGMAAACVLLAGLVAAHAGAAAVQGLITNGTSGKPQAGVQVALMKLEGGMVTVGQAATDTAGRFRFDSPPPAGELPFLIRAEYRGVAYHAPARPPAGGVAGGDIEVDMEVFETTSERAAVRLARQQLIVEPRPGQLFVAESYHLANDTAPRMTFAGAGETFRFTVPEGRVEDLSVMVSGPRQMPVRQNAVERGAGQYALEYPLRPGETRVEVNYRIPYGSAFTFRKSDRPAGETAIIAPLEGITLSGAGLTATSRDESQGAQLYRWSSAAPLEFEISGSLPEARAEGGAGEQEFSTVENPNFVFQARWKILIVLGAALALGLAHLYRLERTSSLARDASRK